MDKNQAIEIIKSYISALPKEKFDVKKVYLFGSYAKGNYTEGSDIDIALVIKDLGDFFDTQFELMKFRRKFDLRIEPHPIDIKDFNKFDPLSDEILKYGIEIL